MDRAAKLYRLYAELAVVKRGIGEFAALRPNPREWTQEEVAHHDLLIKRRTDIRAEIAELESIHARRKLQRRQYPTTATTAKMTMMVYVR